MGAAVTLSACIGSGYTYVSDGATKAYFKVPNDWKEFQRNEVFGDTSQPTRPVFDDPNSLKWFVAFDSDPNPSPAHIFREDFPEYPVVLVRVFELDPVLRQGISLTSIRNNPYPVDQFLNDDQARLLGRDENVVLPGGYHGNHLIFDVAPAGIFTIVPQSQILRVNQISLVDPGLTFLYSFLVRCSASCYSANQSLIDEIVKSWTIKET